MNHRPLAFLALLGSAAAHTNAVGYQVVAAGTNLVDLSIFFGTYHPGSSPEGALALYGYNGAGDTTSPSSYTTKLYGQGGSVGNGTFPMGVPTPVGDINTTLFIDPMETVAKINTMGFTFGEDFFMGGGLHSWQMATIRGINCDTSTTLSLQYDDTPIGAVPRSALSQDYTPCSDLGPAVQTGQFSCSGFNAESIRITIEPSGTACTLGVQGVASGQSPPNAPPPPTIATRLTSCACQNFRNGLNTESVGGSENTGGATARPAVQDGAHTCARAEVHGRSGVQTWCMPPVRPYIPLLDDGCPSDMYACIASYTAPSVPACNCDHSTGGDYCVKTVAGRPGGARVCYPRNNAGPTDVGGHFYYNCPQDMTPCTNLVD